MPEPGTSRARRGYWSNPGTQPWSSWGYAPAGPGWSQYANSPYSPVAAGMPNLGNLFGWSQQANQPVYGAPYGYQTVGYRAPQVGYYAGGIPQAANPMIAPAPASYYGSNQLSSYVPATGVTMGGGWSGGGRWNPWASFTTGTQPGWYSANPATGYAGWAGSTLAGAQANIAGNFPEGSRLIYGSSTYGHSPAPVIGGSRKMSWAGQTKAKKNWNPWKFANRKTTTQTSAPNPLAAAAMGSPGVGLVYGNANWGRP